MKRRQRKALDANATEELTEAPKRAWFRSEWAILAVILFGGLCLRGQYLAEIYREPDFSFPAMDPQYNDYWARGIVTGDWTPPEGYPDPQIRSTPHGRPPGYPYFLALVYFVFGLDYMAPRLVQMALGLVNGALMFFLGRAMFGTKTGLLAAAFMVGYWVFIHFEGEITYPVVAVFCTLIFMLALHHWLKRPSIPRAFGVGLLLGLFGLFRPNGLLFGPVLVAWCAWVLWPRRDWRLFLISSAAFTIGAVLAIAPPLLRNYVVADDFVFLSSYGGVNLWAGNNPDADCVTPKIPDLEEIAGFEDWSCFHYALIVRGLGRKLGKEDLKFSEASDYFYGKAVDFIKRHPLKVLQLTGKRALVFWGPTETTNDKVLDWVKKKSPTLRLLPGFPFVAGMFLVGLLLLLRKLAKGLSEDRERKAMAVAVLLFIFTYFASVMPYFVAGRYRIPVIPFLLLIGAYGVASVAGHIGQGDYRRAGAWVAAGAATCAVGSVQFYAYTPDLAIWHQHRAKAFESKGELDNAIAEVREELRVDPYFADGVNFLGKLLEKQGKNAEAADTYEEALRLDPENHVAHNNLGYLLSEKGETREAFEHYAAALRANPLCRLAHNNLGNLLAEEGRFDEAMDHYAEALRIDPNDRFADYNIGNGLAAQGDLEDAIAHYVRALEVDPRNPDVSNNLGLALERQGKPHEAIKLYQRALAISPDYANAHNNLGYAWAALGDIAKAVEHYEEAIRIEPGFALAHNNLGNLLVREGKADEALRHFERALDADPRDKRAHLNIGDVLSARGEFDEAIGHYGQALENDPANADVPNNMGNALVKAVRFDEAIRYYNRAIEIAPNYVNAHLNLGLVLAGLGRPDEAQVHFRRVLELDPDNARARKALGLPR